MVETFCGFKTAILALHDCILDKFKAKFDLLSCLHYSIPTLFTCKKILPKSREPHCSEYLKSPQTNHLMSLITDEYYQPGPDCKIYLS